MNLSYKLLLPIFFFTSVSATATPPKITPPSYIKQPNFSVNSSFFPNCDCNKLGKPLASCQEQTRTAVVKFLVDTDGKAKNIQVMQSLGTPKADRYLVQQFRRVRFSPALKNNQPIVSSAQQAVSMKYMPEFSPLTCAIEKPKIEELVK